MLEEMLYNRMTQKKKEIQITQSITDTERLWTQIETLQWVLAQSLIIRRQLEHDDTVTRNEDKKIK